jgi:DNA polymerase III delta subunit
MAAPASWLEHAFALVHGEDGDGRREAVEAWRRKHVDPEWEDFSLTICSEGCPWAEVVAALQEAAPLGAAARTVIVPAADNLFSKRRGGPKDKKLDLPEAVVAFLQHPPEGVRLLLVAWTTVPGGPGNPLGAKPWTDWAKMGRVLKVGHIDHREVPAFIEARAANMGLRLGSGGVRLLQERLSNEKVLTDRSRKRKAEGGNPGIIQRTLEVIGLMADGQAITESIIDQATFRLAGERAYAWKNAWMKGDTSGALKALRESLEDDADAASLMLLNQVRSEMTRLLDYLEAVGQGLKGAELLEAIGFSPKQSFLLNDLSATANRLKGRPLVAMVRRVNQTERDLKGMALGKGQTALLDLTLYLCRTWAS